MNQEGHEKTEGVPDTRLALRTWGVDHARLVLRSLNAPSRRNTWVAPALAAPEGCWPHDRPLAAECGRGKAHDPHQPGCPPGCREHDPLPGRECTCGIYAAKNLDMICGYLSRIAPVIGIAELGGRVIPATQGYRAAYARVAAILLVDQALTIDHPTLRKLADAYRVRP